MWAEQTSLAGVTVELSGTRFLSTQTTSTGAFSFLGLPEGEYLVTIAGFPEDVEFSITTKAAMLAKGTTSARVDFNGSKKRDASIGGKVNLEGSGLAGMTISLSGPESRSTVTDGQGAYSFDQLRRGTYSVELTGFDPAVHAFPVTTQTVNVNNGKHGIADFLGTLVPQPPSPPSNLGAAADGFSAISLAWTDVSEDETRFEVERRVEGEGQWNQIAALSPNSTAFHDLGLSPNTTYRYRVRACNDAGCSVFSGEAEATTEDIPPATPSGLSARATGPHSIELVWSDESTNETGFEIQRRLGVDGNWELAATPEMDATSARDSGLEPASTYLYRIRACNGVGCSELSEEVEETTDEVPPQAPQGLAASATGSTTASLSWTDASNNESRFEVERKEGASGPWSRVGTPGPGVILFGDTGLTPNTSYTYRVRACNVAGCSGYSNEATAVTNEVSPHPPSGLMATATGSSTVALNWTDRSQNEGSFRLERKLGIAGSWGEIGTFPPKSTMFTDTGLSPNTGYIYRVRACNDVGCSAYSNEAGATTFDVPPSPPSGLTATTTGPTTVDLSWTDESDNELQFRIERREGAAGTWVQIGTRGGNGETFPDSGLTPGTLYFYRVRACNAAGCSPYSNEDGATTDLAPPQPPSGLTATPIPLNTIDLAWTDNANDETLFRIERKEGAGGSYGEIATLPANSVSFSDPGLAYNTTYYYRIQACHGTGCSIPSNEAHATTWDQAPSPPTGLTASATGSTTVDVGWTDASDNEAGFRVERDEGGNGTFAFSVDLPAGTTSYADTGLSPNTEYWYRVSAFNASGSATSGTEVVTTWAGSGPNLNIANLYLTQSTQTLDGVVPLVADRDGYLRVFAVASAANSLQPSVEVQFFHGGSLVHTETLLAPTSSVPTVVDESILSASWNVAVPGSLIQPGLTLLAEVDPDGQVSEGNEGDNFFPVTGIPLAVDVRTASPFEVTFVPVHQSVNGLVGNVTPGNAPDFMDAAMRMLPMAQANVTVHAEYVSTAPVLESDNGNGAWGTILSEINSLRVAEGSSGYYYGVVKVGYGGGIAGMGYLGWPAAIGWDKLPSGSGVAAHEWGHNFNLRHAPGCGAGSPDPSYPYADGKIGVWGLDVVAETLISPVTRYDFMSYCGPEWISDYNYEKILDYREMQGGYGAPSQPEPSLLVWGRMEGGRIVLEPSFQVATTPVLPSGTGEFLLEGTDGSGEALFALSFQPVPIPDAQDGSGHFAFAIPLRFIRMTELEGLRVSGGGRSPAVLEPRVGARRIPTPEPEVRAGAGTSVEVTWDQAAFPMALVRDPATGDVLSFARGGRVSLSVAAGEVELVFSDGLRSREPVRRAVR
ncbi:MAG: fibronectin type III domain-containing protein [Gemmatimonadota bacterium]